MCLQYPNHEEFFKLYNDLPAELQVAIWKFHIEEYLRKLVSSSSAFIPYSNVQRLVLPSAVRASRQIADTQQ
jgi:hypothetical protein